MADANLTKTIIRNLLANAVKYTPEQGHIYIETVSIDGKVQFIITDTGQGIPLEIKDELFVTVLRVCVVLKVNQGMV